MMTYLYFHVLLFSLLEDATMYGSVQQYDGHDRVLVKDVYSHLKGASIWLMYDYPKRIPFIAAMRLKVHPHF